MQYKQVLIELDSYLILILQFIQSKEKLFFVCHDISAPSNRKKPLTNFLLLFYWLYFSFFATKVHECILLLYLNIKLANFLNFEIS